MTHVSNAGAGATGGYGGVGTAPGMARTGAPQFGQKLAPPGSPASATLAKHESLLRDRSGSSDRGAVSGARGLLLREAMERAQAEDEVDAVDADDLAVGEERRPGCPAPRGRWGR